MKRENNLFDKIADLDNILIAHYNARKGKSKYKQVQMFNSDIENKVRHIQKLLLRGSYKVADYSISELNEGGKKRVIHKLPYNPDRVIHHALLQVVEPILAKTYIKDTYQAIKGRGVHKAKKRLHSFLQDTLNTQYCLKIDIKKFYPSVDNEILKELLRKKIKCQPTLELLDLIIDSTKGLPIGNYTSQTLGNFYLTYFDHYVKEDLKVKYYIRYADDMVFFSNSKEELHKIRRRVQSYLKINLKLKVKENWQVFPTFQRGVDFLGFRFFKGYTLLRKSIKKKYKRLILKINKKGGVNLKNYQALMSFLGWLKHTDSFNLMSSTLTVEHIVSFTELCNKLRCKCGLRNIVIVSKDSEIILTTIRDILNFKDIENENIKYCFR